MQITTIGLDIAKNVFQVHGIDGDEKVVVRKQLRRNQVLRFFDELPPCLVGLEACATSHYWARELAKLGHLPVDARASLVVLAAQLQALQTMIGAIEKRIVKQHRASKDSKRIQTVPGIGEIGASAIAATVTNPRIFRSGRDFAAWIGLVPRQMSTGGKPKLGPISKQGDRYLRRLLVVGAISVLRRAKLDPGKFPWITQMLARRPFKVVAVALANKMARTAWALMMSGKTCRAARYAAA